MISEGVTALRRLAASDVVRELAWEARPGPGVDALSHVQAATRGFFHPVGTCAIGRVVDGRGRVDGIDGLYVADASVMPTIPRANPHLTVVAAAERLAEMMLEASTGEAAIAPGPSGATPAA